MDAYVQYTRFLCLQACNDLTVWMINNTQSKLKWCGHHLWSLSEFQQECEDIGNEIGPNGYGSKMVFLALV